MFARNLGNRVIGDVRDLHSGAAPEAVGAGSRYGEHVDIDPKMIHVLEPATNILALQRRRVDPALELLVIKVPHAAVRIGLFENHGTVEALHFCEVCFRKKVSLEINDHKNIVQGSRFKVQRLAIIFDPKLEP